MPALLQPFNAQGIDPSQGAGQMPIGKHPVIIESSSIEATAANDGGFLQLMLKIIDGPNVGGTGPYRINLYNKSPKAVEIANRQMAAISHVTGVFLVNQSEQLHNIPFIVEVGYQKGQEPGAPDSKGYTEIKRVFDRNGVEPGKQGQAAPPAQPMQQQPQQQPQQQQPQQQPAQAWGAPAQGQPQGQPPAQAPAAAGWGAPQGQAPAAAPAQAWGGGQPAAPAPQPAQGWQQQPQGGAPAGAAPWGAR